MSNRLLTMATAAFLLFSNSGWTADDGAEATIRLMGAAEAELPEAITKEITLPEHLLVEPENQVRAVEKAEKGIEKANQSNDNREQDQFQADEARERAAEIKEKAKESRENSGRSDDHPDPPN